jgi:DNA-directed RNA polymerase specialized sigma24 family protein
VDTPAQRRVQEWSAEGKSTGFLRSALHNKITDAVRSERGDRRTTVDGRRRRVYLPDELPWSQLTQWDVEAADRILTRWHRQSPGPEELVLDAADAGGDNGLGTQRGALHSISEAERELLYRRHVDKAPIRELAAELGISVPAVEKRLGRARRRVHREVTEQVSGSGPKGPHLSLRGLRDPERGEASMATLSATEREQMRRGWAGRWKPSKTLFMKRADVSRACRRQIPEGQFAVFRFWESRAPGEIVHVACLNERGVT